MPTATLNPALLMKSPFAPSSLALALAFGTLGCGPSVDDAVVVATPTERLTRAIIGPGSGCEKPTECDSRVCHIGFCTSLADAGHAWMEVEVAGAVRAILAESPAVWPDLIAAITSVAAEEDPPARSRVAGFLGALSDARGEPYLRTLAADLSPSVSRRAKLALLRLCTASALEGASALVFGTSLAGRLDALDALGACTTSVVAAELLVESLEEDDYRVVERAIQGLTQWETAPPGAVAGLQALWAKGAEGYLAHDLYRALAHFGLPPSRR